MNALYTPEPKMDNMYERGLAYVIEKAKVCNF